MSKAKKVQSSSQQRTLWQETWRRFKKNKLAVAGMIFLIALVVIAIATIIIDAVNPSIYETYVIKQNLRERLAPPSAAHIFGQDEFGRDMLMRILWSIRSSLFMGALSIALSCIVGGRKEKFSRENSSFRFLIAHFSKKRRRMINDPVSV